MFHRHLEHVLRAVNADHIIASVPEAPGHLTCPAAKIKDKTIINPITGKNPTKLPGPAVIRNIVHKFVINLRKAFIHCHVQ